MQEHIDEFKADDLKDYIDCYLNEVYEQRGNVSTVFKEDCKFYFRFFKDQ